MIEFVVKQCSLDVHDKSLAKLGGSDEMTPTMLRNMSDKTLQLITTTIEHMDTVLWPYLLEFLVPAHYTLATGIVCKCVADIAGKKREAQEEDYMLNYEELGEEQSFTNVAWYYVCVCVDCQ